MNPIIYLDEIDKISETRATEIFGVLTHLLDEEQNAEFEDNYLSNIKIDLSKVFFVIAFNDISKVDSILLNRLKVIYIDPPSIEDKITICQTKLIPNILKTIKLKSGFNIILERELIEYIIACKTQEDKGLRQLQKNIEKIFNRLNYDILIDNLDLVKKETVQDSEDTTLIITRSYIDKIIKTHNNDRSYLQMYN
jgi:ATP-dependent Lon protease